MQFAPNLDADRMIQAGHDPKSLTHLLYYPDGGYCGLANPLPPGTDLSGYISEYYTLEELASRA